LATEEVIIGSQSCIIRDLENYSANKTLNWDIPVKSLGKFLELLSSIEAHSFPFLIGLSDKQIEIRNRYEPDFHQIITT
jgi:hypothetical protein